MQIEQALPIQKYKQQIVSQIQSNTSTIICGQTGSGKTTQVPQYLYEHYQNIIITQPRRISAITLAQRVAYEMGFTLGQEIGYCVRFQEKRTIGKTRITFMTDGMAIREIMAGRKFDVFVVDQAHQRSINTDVLLALLRHRVMKNKQINHKSQSKQKINNNSNKSLSKYKQNININQNEKSFNSNIKIVVMSATIQSQKFLNFFQTDSIVRMQGRTYPTQIYNLLQPVQNYLQACYNAILQVHYTEESGDILVFLTGQQQILTLQKRLLSFINHQNPTIFSNSPNTPPHLKILPLYSSIPHQSQQQIFSPPTPQIRKIILATNIAQTSITINGLKYVIDSGFMKIRVYDCVKGVDMLAVVPVAKANARQRSGRAGREGPGKCYRIYCKGDYEELKEYVEPQILRSQLSGPILQLKAIGIPKIEQLQFPDQPPSQTIKTCLNLLNMLGCLTVSEQITEYGLQLSKIPLPPYLANLLLKSNQHKCQQLMINVLSVLSIDSLFYVGKEDREDKEGGKSGAVYGVLKKYMVVGGGSYVWSDHLAKANVLQQYIGSSNKKAFCKGNFINKNNIKRAVQIRQQLAEYLEQILTARRKKDFVSLTSPSTKVQPLLVASYKPSQIQIQSWLLCMEKNNPSHVARLNRQGINYTIIESGQIAYIHPESLLFFSKTKPQYVVFYQVIKTSRLYLRDVTGLQGISVSGKDKR